MELQDEIVQCDSNIIALRQELEMLHQRLVHTRDDLEHQLMTLEVNIILVILIIGIYPFY